MLEVRSTPIDIVKPNRMTIQVYLTRTKNNTMKLGDEVHLHPLTSVFSPVM